MTQWNLIWNEKNNSSRSFNLQSALAEAVITVDEMCTNSRYQAGKKYNSSQPDITGNNIPRLFPADYLRHAPCIKSLATDDAKCRQQYNNLVAQVSAFSISNVQICW